MSSSVEVPGRREWAAALALGLAGALPRVLTLFNDFWLDEIWSWNLVYPPQGPVGLLAALAGHPSHPLNNLFLRLLGADAPAPLYRSLSLAAGVASLLLVYLAARGSGRAEGLASLALASGSLLLVNFSSEARGYSSAVFFALAAFLLAGRAGRKGGRAAPALYWLCALFGLLSHATFLFALAGVLARGVVGAWRGGRSPAARGAAFLRLHGVPLALAAGMAAWWRGSLAIGGPRESLGKVLGDLAGFALGARGAPSLAVAAGILAAGAAGWEIWRLARERSEEAVFFTVALVAAPVAAIAAFGAEFLAPRFFTVCLPFALLLLGRFLGRLWRRGGARAALASLLLALYLAGNLVSIAGLVRGGRGRYREALRYMAGNTPPGAPLTVGSDHDFRNGMVIAHYAPSLPRELVYVAGEAGIEADRAPRWLIVHRLAGEPAPADGTVARIPSGGVYRQVRSFPVTGPSGLGWFIYRRIR